MNKILKQQLKSCNVAVIPDDIDNRTSLTIPKFDPLRNKLCIGFCYHIQISDSVLHPSPDSTIASNWNGGSVPSDKYMNCQVQKRVGKMAYITGSGMNSDGSLTGRFWEGWLPDNSVTIIDKIGD